MLGIDSVAPDFQLSDVQGKPFALASLFEHGAVLLAFFKVSCPTCQLTFPFLDRLAAGGHLGVVGISQNDAPATEQFAKAYGVRFPLLLDTSEGGYRVSNAFGITNVPSIFVVEQDGRIAEAFHGFSRKDIETIGHRYHTGIFYADETVPAFRPG